MPMRKLCFLRSPFRACLKINSKAQQMDPKRASKDGFTKERSISCKIISYVRTTLFANVLVADMRLISSIDEYVTHPDFKQYNLRVTEPKLCDPSVKQHSGYLDVAEDKHLFFW